MEVIKQKKDFIIIVGKGEKLDNIVACVRGENGVKKDMTAVSEKTRRRRQDRKLCV